MSNEFSPVGNSPPTLVKIYLCAHAADMQAEREMLRRFVLPELAARCREFGVELELVDPRGAQADENADWAESLGDRFALIEACRPWFIGLLGDRVDAPATNISDEILEANPWINGQKSASCLELELVLGALRASKTSFVYLRDDRFLQAVPPEIRSNYSTDDYTTIERIESLKDRIRRSGRPVFDGYPCRWDNESKQVADLEEFGKRILEDLYESLQQTYAQSASTRSTSQRGSAALIDSPQALELHNDELLDLATDTASFSATPLGEEFGSVADVEPLDFLEENMDSQRDPNERPQPPSNSDDLFLDEMFAAETSDAEKPSELDENDLLDLEDIEVSEIELVDETSEETIGEIADEAPLAGDPVDDLLLPEAMPAAEELSLDEMDLVDDWQPIEEASIPAEDDVEQQVAAEFLAQATDAVDNEPSDEDPAPPEAAGLPEEALEMAAEPELLSFDDEDALATESIFSPEATEEVEAEEIAAFVDSPDEQTAPFSEEVAEIEAESNAFFAEPQEPNESGVRDELTSDTAEVAPLDDEELFAEEMDIESEAVEDFGAPPALPLETSEALPTAWNFDEPGDVAPPMAEPLAFGDEPPLAEPLAFEDQTVEDDAIAAFLGDQPVGPPPVADSADEFPWADAAAEDSQITPNEMPFADSPESDEAEPLETAAAEEEFAPFDEVEAPTGDAEGFDVDNPFAEAAPFAAMEAADAPLNFDAPDEDNPFASMQAADAEAEQEIPGEAEEPAFNFAPMVAAHDAGVVASERHLIEPGPVADVAKMHSKKKLSPSLVLAVLGLVVLLTGGSAAGLYALGLIPGFGNGNQQANLPPTTPSVPPENETDDPADNTPPAKTVDQQVGDAVAAFGAILASAQNGEGQVDAAKVQEAQGFLDQLATSQPDIANRPEITELKEQLAALEAQAADYQRSEEFKAALILARLEAPEKIDEAALAQAESLAKTDAEKAEIAALRQEAADWVAEQAAAANAQHGTLLAAVANGVKDAANYQAAVDALAAASPENPKFAAMKEAAPKEAAGIDLIASWNAMVNDWAGRDMRTVSPVDAKEMVAQANELLARIAALPDADEIRERAEQLQAVANRVDAEGKPLQAELQATLGSAAAKAPLVLGMKDGRRFLLEAAPKKEGDEFVATYVSDLAGTTQELRFTGADVDRAASGPSAAGPAAERVLSAVGQAVDGQWERPFVNAILQLHADAKLDPVVKAAMLADLLSVASKGSQPIAAAFQPVMEELKTAGIEPGFNWADPAASAAVRAKVTELLAKTTSLKTQAVAAATSYGELASLPVKPSITPAGILVANEGNKWEVQLAEGAPANGELVVLAAETAEGPWTLAPIGSLDAGTVEVDENVAANLLGEGRPVYAAEPAAP